MFNFLSRKMITATLAATLSLGAGLAATTAEAHPHGHHHGHYGHWHHGYWGGGLLPIVIGGYGDDCYFVRERVVDRHGYVHYRRVKVCN
jgi:hypothetical protein